MKLATNAVTTILSDIAVVMFLSIFVDFVAYVFEADSRFYKIDSNIHAFSCNVNQSVCLCADFPNSECFAGVSVVAIFDDCDVYVDDVAFF